MISFHDLELWMQLSERERQDSNDPRWRKIEHTQKPYENTEGNSKGLDLSIIKFPWNGFFFIVYDLILLNVLQLVLRFVTLL